MKRFILVLIVACISTPALAARGTCRGGSCKVAPATVRTTYSIPTVGKSSYTIEHPAVVAPKCKDGKCRLSK